VSDLLDPKDVEKVARALCVPRRGEPCVRVSAYKCEVCDFATLTMLQGEAAIRAMQPAPLPVVRFKDGERDV
jgi:hypothetical protein